jgi:primosomal protein N' (replication factor Y)
VRIAEVFLNQKNKRIDHPYDYIIPPDLEAEIKVGMRVIVPFGKGNNQVEAIVILVKETTDYQGKIKVISRCIDREPVLNKDQIELCRWIKATYCSLFYDALSYFTMSNKLTSETLYFRSEGDFSLNLQENWFIEHYFGNNNYGILKQKIKPEDQSIFLNLIDKKVIYALKNWKPTSKKEDQNIKDDHCYGLTASGKEALTRKLKMTAKQKLLLSYLSRKEMSVAELKVYLPGFEKSLRALVEKSFVLRIEENESLNLKKREIPIVTLTEKERNTYMKFRSMLSENMGVYFQVFENVSKYRVFFKIIEDLLKQDKTVVIIFPEVNMTFQRMELFIKYFGDKVGVFHGKLTTNQRLDFFGKVKNGEIKVVVGVRSALFLPFSNLGLIIVDEEHDPSHYMISAPKFHIADIVCKYSEISAIPFILADEVPRVESWYKVENNMMNMLQIGDAPLHQNNIHIIDMKKEIQSGNMGTLSRAVKIGIKDAISAGKLSVLFHNNTGYANSLFCRNCGHLEKCPNCGVSLKYSDRNQKLYCHYCGYTKNASIRCSKCGSDQLRHMGLGIDHLEEYLRKVFPHARIVSIQGKINQSEIRKINDAISESKIQVLIGTQTIINHFSFKNVGIAAAVLIDRDLSQESFNAGETTYRTYSRFFKKTMNQDTKGYIQTYETENDTIYSIKKESFQEFYRGEILYRQLMNYPPFCNMIVFCIFQKNRSEVEQDAIKLYIGLKNEQKKIESTLMLYKPVAAGMLKGGNNAFQIVLKVKKLDIFQNFMDQIISLGIIERLKSKVSVQVY